MQVIREDYISNITNNMILYQMEDQEEKGTKNEVEYVKPQRPPRAN